VNIAEQIQCTNYKKVLELHSNRKYLEGAVLVEIIIEGKINVNVVEIRFLTTALNLKCPIQLLRFNQVLGDVRAIM
jgi:hypothetical protein